MTCRRRHVKCDEARPTCSNCGKKNRTCQYGAPSQGQDRCTDPEYIQNSPPPRHGHSEASESRVREPSEHGGSMLSLASPTAVGDVTIETATLESILLSSDYYLPHADALQAAVQIHSPHAADAVALQPLHLHTDCPIQLSVTEVAIFRNYVEHVSHWVSIFPLGGSEPADLISGRLVLSRPAIPPAGSNPRADMSATTRRMSRVCSKADGPCRCSGTDRSLIQRTSALLPPCSERHSSAATPSRPRQER